MVPEESLYAVALSMVKNIDGVTVKRLIEHGFGPEDVFGRHSAAVPELGWITDDMKSEALRKAEAEIGFMMRHKVRPLFIDDEEYPRLLAEAGNPPVVLYMLGDADLNPSHSLSIVGTRQCTPYGEGLCSKLTADIGEAFPGTLIVSGLAYGIDAAAHKGALAANLPTVGVLGHGLDMIYPAAHRGLASTMIQRGGALLTEYPKGTRPHRNHFLERNRIVATMSQGVVLAESPLKGGAMSTASIAFSYSRDVMAFPGRPTDETSKGCNSLIKNNKASLIENLDDVCHILGWQKPEGLPSAKQESLFPELSGDVKTIYDFLKRLPDPQSVDTISYQCSLSIVNVMTLLPDMEFEGLVQRHPGNRYVAI